MNFIKNTLLTSVLSSLIVLASFSQASADRLMRAVADWTGGMVTCEVAEQILEQELGYKIDSIVFPSGTGLWEAVADGSDIQFACESWPSYAEADEVMINQDLIYDGEVVKDDYNGDGSIEAYTTGIIGSSDYFVPKYFVDANPDFKGWEDLNKYKDQFATAETGGKGRLIGCAVPGWNCHDQKRLDLLGIDFVADELGTEVAALAEASAAYDRGEAFLLYFFTPHWFQGAYEMVPVNLPANVPCETFNEANNFQDCGVGKWPATGWAKDYTINYMNPEVFAKPENASAKAFFQKMNLDNADQAAMINEIDKNGRDIVEVVQEWKDNNQDAWSTWLP